MIVHKSLLLLLLSSSYLGTVESSAPSLGWSAARPRLVGVVARIRGGGDLQTQQQPNNSTPKKRKRKKKSASLKKVKRKTRPTGSKGIVNDALKESDAADALGEAIRNKADELREEKDDPELQHIRDSVRSVGLALGASDHHGVEVDPGSVLAHYFLNSHGGAHGLQCICSVLAATTGIGALLLKGEVQLVLLKRCMAFAMIKHVAGLLAASFIAAKGIPLSGYRRAANLMEDLSRDPVSQYVFYAANILLWLPRRVAKSSSEGPPVGLPTIWWQSLFVVPFSLVAPVVLRELISTALVVSDVLVLWSTTVENAAGVKRTLAIFRGIVNAAMSLLVTPKVWIAADAAQRQAILARITSKASLLFELVVGTILAVDCIVSAAGFTSGNSGPLRFLKRYICTRLYLQFLWTRRQKIKKLASTVRGGARHVPLYILEVLMDPQGAMGLEDTGTQHQQQKQEDVDNWTWRDYARIALDLS